MGYERTTGDPPAQPQAQAPPPQPGMYANPEKGGSGELPQQPYRPYPQHPSYTQPAPPPAAAPPLTQQWTGYGGMPSPGGQGPMPNAQTGGMYPQYTGGPGSPPGTFNGYHPGAYHQNSFNTGGAGDRGMPGMQPQWTGQMGQMGQQPPMGYGQPGMPMMYGVTPDQQCAQQGHIITSRFGIVGLLSAFFLFPCGIIVCFMDQTEKCERCHHIFKHGILD